MIEQKLLLFLVGLMPIIATAIQTTDLVHFDTESKS